MSPQITTFLLLVQVVLGAGLFESLFPFGDATQSSFSNSRTSQTSFSPDSSFSKTARQNVLREILPYNPVAPGNATVIVGHVRFTVLTDRMIRIERGQGTFRDEATLAFVNRDLSEVPKFTYHVESHKFVHIITKHLHLKYTMGTAFSEDTLTITSDNFEWHYGKKDKKNLHGTIRSLDLIGPTSLDCSSMTGKLKIFFETLHCTEGLVSRSGWAVVNESDAPIIEPNSGWWEDKKLTDYTDIVFFGYGSDFKGAIKDYTKVGGKPALIPRAGLGTWWTRWFPYDQLDIENIIQEFDRLRLGLDVVILDMNYHTKQEWGTYSYDRGLFPFGLQVLKEKFPELVYGLNLHDNNGVAPFEEMYEEVKSALNLETNKTIKFQYCTNSSYAFAVEDIVLEHLDFEVDWIDWQQGGRKGGCTDGKFNPTIWLNRVRALKSIRKNKNTRDMVLGRFGGLGNHRYPVGFSGDVSVVTWETLAYQPYFTFTAANVAFGLWSHDITGPKNNPELATRWIQWGSLSPILRFHERGMSAGTCDFWFPDNKISDLCTMGYPWDLPFKHLAAARYAIHQRLSLLPYIYNSLRDYHDTGLSIVYPMYYDHPDEEYAYASDMHGNFSQYMFGKDLLVAPVVSAASSGNSFLAKKFVWIPEGTWIEEFSGHRYVGPIVVSNSYDLDEIPVFIKAGSVIPRLDLTKYSTLMGVASRRRYEHLTFTLYLDPSVDSGEGYVYEDDGQSLDYLSAKTSNRSLLKYSFVDGALKMEVDLTAPVEIHLPHAAPLDYRDIMVNEQEVIASDSVRYCAKRMMSIIEVSKDVKKIAISKGVVTLDGLKGRVKSVRACKKVLDEVKTTPGATSVKPTHLIQAASAFPVRLVQEGQNPTNFVRLVDTFNEETFPAAKTQVKEMKGNPILNSRRIKYCLALMRRF